MNNKNKIVSFILVFVICLCSFVFPAYAENTALGDKIPGATNSVLLNLNIEKADNFIPAEYKFDLYDSNKNLLSSESMWINSDNVSYKEVFNFPASVLGDVVYISLNSPVLKITVGDATYGVNDLIPFGTQGVDQYGQSIFVNEFSLSVTPASSNPVNVTVNGSKIEFKNLPKIINNTCMVPLYEYLNSASLSESAAYDKNSGEITVILNYNTLKFKLNSKVATANEVQNELSTEVVLVNNAVYVPLRFLVESGEGTVEASNNELGILCVDTTLFEANRAETIVNENNIKSLTKNLIWVSKSDYKVTVFTDVGGKWKFDRQFDCAIGAKNTPTITGEYTYYSKEKQWSYEGYYVAPIMRFYNGYALHSTLIKYDGTPYDDTVGKMISHGCVRLHPEDINWLAENIPLDTKIYITN